MTESANNDAAETSRSRGPIFFGLSLTLRQLLTQWLLPASALLALAAGGPPIVRSLSAAVDEPPAQRSQDAMPVEVAPAAAVTSYSVNKPYTGTLVAGRRSRLGFERPGKIIQLNVDEGQRVEAGQVLAELDRRRLTASRLRVAAELSEARAVLAELVAGPRRETIAAAAAEVRSLAAQREVARRNLSRRAELVESAAISREEYDESFYTTKVAEARVDAASKQLEELETGTRVERVDAQKARVAALAARLADVDHEIEDTVLTAPFAGSITRRHVDEGVIVQAGDPVFGLIEDNRLEAWIGVPAAAAGRLAVGDAATIVVDGATHSVAVRSIRSELDPATRTRNVVFSIEQPTAGEASVNRLVAGQVARVLLSETVEERGFWTPTSALTPSRRGLWAVYVAEGAGPTRTVATRDVELLHTEGGRSFVRGTLQEGESIIVAGGHKIVAGQKVAVVGSR